MNYWTIFFTGLTAGGFSCLALQGGLLAATLATTAEEKDKTSDWLPTAMFLLSKIIAYTLLGGLLGLFGSIFQLSDTIKILFIVSASILMFGLAGNMLNLHPIFRYFVITPPKWAARLLRDQSKSKSLVAPAILGALTVFIPCGVTQAMEIAAVASGNVFSGALTMFMFTLGTSPIFMALGFVTTRLSENFRAKFFKIAGVLVVFIALSNVNAALVLANSRFTWDNFVWAFKETFLTSNKQQVTSNKVEITATSYGYSPREFTVKNNEPVSVTINSKNNRSCARAFSIPSLGISKILPENGTETVSFTPSSTGRIAFTCSMGMYTGVINVVN
jgi:sulfite exporter TauE/SafE